MTRRQPRTSRCLALSRLLASVLALALMGAQLASIGHHVLVAHYLCSVHGTLHHGTAPAVAIAAAGDTPTVTSSAELDHGTHDDCAFPIRTPDQLAELPELAALGAQETPADARVVLAPARAHVSISLLALAPKLSPPELG